MNPFDPIFLAIHEAVEADDFLADAFDIADSTWIDWGLPPEAAAGPIPCIRLDAPSSGNSLQGDHTVILNIWSDANNTDKCVALASALQAALNDVDGFYVGRWDVRYEPNYTRAIMLLGFTL